MADVRRLRSMAEEYVAGADADSISGALRVLSKAPIVHR